MDQKPEKLPVRDVDGIIVRGKEPCPVRMAELAARAKREVLETPEKVNVIRTQPIAYRPTGYRHYVQSKGKRTRCLALD